MSGTSSPRFRRVLFVAKVDSDGPRIVDNIARRLEQEGIAVCFESQTAHAMGRDDGLLPNDLPDDLDLGIVAGGDGTLLAAARLVSGRGVPLLGINLGSLGFLTEMQPEEVDSGVQQVLEGRYTIEQRQALRAQHVPEGGISREYIVLNDAVITKSALSRMIQIDVRVDGSRVAEYSSDGLIVATPTGSTAYNLSAGGPILDPRMSAFVVTPICPHGMTFRPLVVPGNADVEISLRSSGEQVYATLDGQIGFPLNDTDRLLIDCAPEPVRLVRVNDREFFQVLRRKLRWGER
ncbi:MAG: NAD(+)/NADH kinase [Acidobacteriota bacterium]|nr:NAD(+)/NADH kinase [Acidobacteriota bacterium]MDH3783871.1 NAD(+)/NADH kinase [Acidobacteriota bacterium]